MKLYNEIDLAYIAGFIDGEGYLGLRHSKGIQAALTITNSKVEILEWIKDILNLGTIYKYKTTKEKHKQVYQLWFRREEIKKILILVMPYLKLKKEQAQLLLTFFKLAFGDKETKQEYYWKMRELNFKGICKPEKRDLYAVCNYS